MSRNRLASETSPYLLQHADNPVDWYPWGPEALAAARDADKPILLSIGYSACHWCHVMAHECFEDAGIAALMNRDFINIKVDREERPDLDKIYQTAQQLLTQRSGGWPLTLFLSPENQRPFFGGTYFPKKPGHGLPGFGDLLARVTQYFATQRAAINNQNEQLVASLARLATSDAAATLDDVPLLSAREALERTFDREYGGFGGAPKFPQTSSLERCLLQWYASSGSPTPDLQALYMATLTLTRMAEGGIYDQLAGGFARYSTDARWEIPHFEKMLYDNGLLLSLYAAAHRATGEPLFARIAADTADWLLRDMRSADGAFCSSLDADSATPEGTATEGIYYVWTREEATALLSPDEYDIVAWRYGLDREPNFEGRWHLRIQEPLDKLKIQSGDSPEVLLDTARAKLLEARNGRSAPARDEKILTSWNALAIKGLALTGRVLGRPDLIAGATAAVDFIRARLWRGGRLLATAKDGRAHLNAYLDDYAFLAAALLELLQSRWRSSDLKWAQELVGVLMTQFADADHGGFFFTAADHEILIQRTKTFADDSLPAGNGIAAAVLTRLGLLLGDLGMLQAAERTLQAGQQLMLEYPLGHMTMINAQAEFLASTQIILIRGSADEVERWAAALDVLYAPTRMVLAIPSDATDLPAAIADKPAIDGLTTAYVCTGMTCAPPVHDLESLARLAAANLASAQRVTSRN